ncbi:CzcE family metal-binding protein [Ampullimonas aquatilis]|uniref:CzcE family metal-binding protein n=1 Tax=Ampullimonas aquatilis TaxID=1341549 RepID=UPI003C787802
MSFTTLSPVLRRSLLALTLLSAALQAHAAFSVKSPLGSRIDGAVVDREIQIDKNTHWVNVQKNERIRFVNADTGKSFQWQFDTLDHPIIVLKNILPAATDNMNVKVFVGTSPDEVN